MEAWSANVLTCISETIGNPSNLLFSALWSTIDDVYNMVDDVGFEDIKDSNKQNTLNIISIEAECANQSSYPQVLGGEWPNNNQN